MTSAQAWLECGPQQWCTPESKGRYLIRRTSDYHEIVGGDFYHYIPLELYLVLAWDAPDVEALLVCETLEEAKAEILKLCAFHTDSAIARILP